MDARSLAFSSTSVHHCFPSKSSFVLFVTGRGLDVASIRRQGKSWQAIVRRKGHPTKSQFFPKKALAEAWARKIEEEVSKKLHFNNLASETTVEALMNKYKEDITPRKRGAGVEKYRIATVIEHLGDHTLTDLSPTTIIEFVDERLEDVSSDSVRKELNVLSQAIDAGMALWKIELPANPVHTARSILKVTKTLSSGVRRTRRPTEEELETLYASRIGDIIEFAVETGMRRGEICNMEPEHKKGNILHIPETKTDTPRTIPLSKRACELFSTVQKMDILPHSISTAYRRICAECGIQDLRFHDLRHEAASRFFEKNLSIAEVANITGQSFATLQRYTHLKASDIAKKL